MTLYPNTAALFLADTMRTALVGAELALFKGIAAPLAPSIVLGDLTEADFDNYARITIAAWLPSYLDPAGGASFQSGTQQFDFVPGLGTTNNVLGFYVLNAGGDLILVGEFDAPIAMNALGDSIPLNVTLNYGATAP